MPFTEEEWADVAETIPVEDDPVIQKYLQGREALIGEEKRRRSDHSFRKSLSPIAQRACAIVAAIRAEEQREIWTPKLEEQLAQGVGSAVTVFPGMMFTLAKELMEQTKLWRIVRRMPKGCLLHGHCDAMVDFNFLSDVLLRTPGMHLLCPDGHLATETARADAALAVCFRKTEHTDGQSIWREDYVPGTPVLLARAADAFPDGGREGFLRWLTNRCTISRTDAVEQHHGVDEIWRKFGRCFAVAGTIIHYEPIFRAFLRRLMSQLVEDGLRWVEIRFTWPLDYCREGQEEPERDYSHMFQVIDEEVNEFKASAEGASFWGLRMIWTSMRSHATRPLLEDMDHCITTKLEFPHLVAGYDLVGQEDAATSRPLADLLRELVWFRAQCAAEGVSIPLFLHAGETLGDGTAADGNVFDAVLLGARRIGHGFSLYRHPLLCELLRDRRVLVESCPISNEVLRLCGSVLAHPLPALLARGVPCSLNNDDPAVLGQGTAGTTHDFWQALQGWENLGLAGLGSLAENSVRWAAFEDQTQDEWMRDIKEASLGSGARAERLKEWSVEWEEFCLWIVTEYGEEYGEEL